MAKQNINVGSAPLAGDGEPLRDALVKVNQNFNEVYNALEDTVTLIENYNFDTNANLEQLETKVNNLDIADLQDASSLIPQLVSDLENDAQYITVEEVPVQLESSHYNLTERYTLLDSVSFTKVVGISEFDYIDDSLTLTRDARTPETDGGGIYNSELESDWDATQSPVGLLWNCEGWENLDNVMQRQYVNFRQALKNRIGNNVVGLELIAHDTINDKYYTFLFSQWDQGPNHNGGFSYTRRLIDTSKDIGLLLADGSNIVTAPQKFSSYPQTYVGDTSGYHLVREDAGKHVFAFGVNITVPHKSSVNFPIGSIIKIVSGNLPVNLFVEDNVSIYSSTTTSQDGAWTVPANTIATLMKTYTGTSTAPDQWVLSVPYSNTTEIINIIKSVVEVSTDFDDFKQRILNL